MCKRILVFFSLGVVLMVTTVHVEGEPYDPDTLDLDVPGQAIICFRQINTIRLPKNAISCPCSSLKIAYPKLDSIFDELEADSVRRVCPARILADTLNASLEMKRVRLSLYNTYTLFFSDSLDVREVIESFRALPDSILEYVHRQIRFVQD